MVAFLVCRRPFRLRPPYAGDLPLVHRRGPTGHAGACFVCCLLPFSGLTGDADNGSSFSSYISMSPPLPLAKLKFCCCC